MAARTHLGTLTDRSQLKKTGKTIGLILLTQNARKPRKRTKTKTASLLMRVTLRTRRAGRRVQKSITGRKKRKEIGLTAGTKAKRRIKKDLGTGRKIRTGKRKKRRKSTSPRRSRRRRATSEVRAETERRSTTDDQPYSNILIA